MKVEERVTIFESLIEKYESEGYVKTERILSMLKANLMSFVISLPIFVVCCIIYFQVTGELVMLFNATDLLYLLLILIGICFVHEFCHGITWGFFCKDKNSISYGFMLKALAPYCTCAEPLPFKPYMLGALMPFIAISIIPFIFSLILSSQILFLISMLNVFGCSGDLTMALMLLEHKESLIIDHPTKCGFIVFDKV